LPAIIASNNKPANGVGEELNGAGSQKGILQITVGREPRSGDEAA